MGSGKKAASCRAGVRFPVRVVMDVKLKGVVGFILVGFYKSRLQAILNFHILSENWNVDSAANFAACRKLDFHIQEHSAALPN